MQNKRANTCAFIIIAVSLHQKKKQKQLNPKTRKGREIMTRNDYSIYNEVQSIKASKRNWNLIVLVKNGEYFEAYEQDADQVSGFCGVGQFNRQGCLLNIAGFHKDHLPFYLPKLLRAGWKVSILDK